MPKHIYITQRLVLYAALITGCMLLNNFAMAAGGPASSLLNNTLAIMMIIIMVILLLIIGLLANVLLGTAGFYARKMKKDGQAGNKGASPAAMLLVCLLACSFPAMAQDATTTSSAIAGLSPVTFYILSGVIFLEILVIMVLLINVKILLAKEKKRQLPETLMEKPAFQRWQVWWSKVNQFKPVHEEVKIDLGHDYDGIRELDNRLPPWWLYGFYLTIFISVIYLWRYHVSHTAPSSIEELQIAMVNAAREKEEYLKKAAANIDENSVKYLADATDIQAGGKVFQINCAACHGKAGEGMVGPNLTDDYWLNGGSIRDIFKTIKYGVPEKGMKSWKEDFSPKQLAQLSSYIQSLKGTNPPNAKEKQGEMFREQMSADSSSRKTIASTDQNR
jgi:cytochrome c oxidase cbb3-type subunit III